MNLWLIAMVSLLCALSGVAFGHWFSRLRSPYWSLGYFIPLIWVFAYALAFHFPGIMFLPPFAWMAMGIKKFAIFGFVTAMVLTTPLSRIPQKRNRVTVAVLMAVMLFSISVWPFVAPLIDRNELSHLQTTIDREGICHQTTAYTCGPAAAVTALRELGFTANEGRIAILSCTSFQEGTTEDMLADGLKNEYGAAGLSVQCRTFKSIADLKQAGLTLAVVKYGFLVDHWVAVLEVANSEVIIGDPAAGKDRLSYEEFAKRWRFVGIVLKRTSSS